MDDELEVDPKYKEGFNLGYIIDKENQKLSEQIHERVAKSELTKERPYDKGLMDGIETARKEEIYKMLDKEKTKKKGYSQ